MRLPAEIRLKILRELLWHPEPLKVLGEISRPTWDNRLTGTNFTFYPEILAVCRKLNEEGGPVLYEENTVDVVVYRYKGYPFLTRFEWMGVPESLATISESLSARARKLRITIDVERPLHDAFRTMRTHMRQLVNVLRANPQWCSLDVRLGNHILNPMPCGRFSDEKNGIWLDEEILRPLQLLRRLQHIEFTGVSPQFAVEMTELMKSDRPIVDLQKMFDALEDYAYRSINDKIDEREVFSEEDMRLAEEAMEACNVTNFYKYRNKVIWDLEKFLRKQRADAFKNDPDPTCSRLSNLEFIAEQDRLENLERERELVEAP
jgi:hypothetical protein